MSLYRDIDISLLRTFLTVAETRGMTAAANTLNLTQGAVSQKIGRLEALFDVQLFHREKKVIRLTTEGERLFSRASRMVELNDETWQFMTQPSFTGEIKLGVPIDITRPIMPPILRRYSREHPRIQLTLVSDMTENLMDALKNGEIDLTLTTELNQRVQGTTLLRDQLVWIGAKNGDACNKKPLPVSVGSEFCAFREPALQQVAFQEGAMGAAKKGVVAEPTGISGLIAKAKKNPLPSLLAASTVLPLLGGDEEPVELPFDEEDYKKAYAEQAAKLDAEVQTFLDSGEVQNIIDSSVSKEEAQSKISSFL